MTSRRSPRRGGREHGGAVFLGTAAAREFVDRTATAAFSCRTDGTVLTWNAKAEKTFGHTAQAAVHRKCYELLLGTDVFGNDFCSVHCAVRQMALRDRPVLPYRMDVRDSSGRSLAVRTMVLVLRDGGGEPELVHLFDPLVPAFRQPPAKRPSDKAPQA